MKVFNKNKYRNMFFTIAPSIFLGLISIVYIFNLVPREFAPATVVDEPITIPVVDAPTSDIAPAPLTQVKPKRISIASIGIDTVVSVPPSIEISVLDNALLAGAVYYPGSGGLNGGNALVFGHSTGLSVVKNQAFKAFNNLKNVKPGDLVYVTGDDGYTYVYKAGEVELVDQSEELVEFNTNSNMITLSTCNTFGQKQERHVLKAYFAYRE